MQNLILLHGALGSQQQFDVLKNLLHDSFTVHTFNFNGHGGSTLSHDNFGITLFTEQLKQFITDKNLAPANVFGYSMGGYVALYLAHQQPASINSIATLATKFAWSPTSAQAEARMLNPEKMEEKIPAFAQQLKNTHQPTDWKLLVNAVANMMLDLGNTPALTDEMFKHIQQKVLLMTGDNDKMVSIAETNHVHDLLPDSTFTILENTPHPFEKVNHEMLAEKLVEFFGR